MLSGNASVARRSAPRTVALLLTLACVFTLLNAVKPLHIDDPFMYRVAEQIVSSPLDPYGFDIFWLQWPQPVSEELTPPVTPYWWAAALVLCGDRPFAWHLWLLPYALIFAWALHALLRRFARGTEIPVLAMTLISPTFLPGFNMMQDVPAMALGLTALALFLRGEDRGPWSWTIASGLVAGLAVQAKYTAVAVLAAIVVIGIVRRRRLRSLVAAGIGLAIFFAWELAMTAKYGRGMFFNQVEHGLFWFPRWKMIVPLITMLGGTIPVVALLGLTGSGVGRRLLVGLAGTTLTGFMLLAWLPVQGWLFLLLGSGVCAVLGFAVFRGLRVGRGAWRRLRIRPNSPDLFLALWLALEIGVYFGASPFPAVRRVMGVVVVATLILARQAALARRQPGGRVPLSIVALASVALGLGYWAVDWRDAEAQRGAVPEIAAAISEIDPEPTIWYVGHWGFQFYAERAGMRPVVPDRTLLRRGDWLVVPSPVDQQEIRLGAQDAILIHTLESKGFPPVRASYGYYGGSVPLSHHDGPGLTVQAYRIVRDVVPESDWTAGRLADWALRAGGRTAAAAAPALTRVLTRSGPEERALAARGLAEILPDAPQAAGALALGLEDGEATVRYWSAVGLGRLGADAAIFVPALERCLDDPVAEVREAAGRSLRDIGRAEAGGR